MDPELKRNYIHHAIEQLFVRDDDGNLINQGLNDIEGELFLQLQNLNCAVGESMMDNFEQNLKRNLYTTLYLALEEFERRNSLQN